MSTAWKDWSPHDYLHQLQNSPRAAQGYVGDLRGMEWADTCVLLLPSGNSAHIEAGYMKGRGKRLIIYYHNNDKSTVTPEKSWTFEPDLMYLLADNLVIGIDNLLSCLQHGK
jgi:nucleoside 2-deoxyribosyltransferase